MSEERNVVYRRGGFTVRKLYVKPPAYAVFRPDGKRAFTVAMDEEGLAQAIADCDLRSTGVASVKEAQERAYAIVGRGRGVEECVKERGTDYGYAAFGRFGAVTCARPGRCYVCGSKVSKADIVCEDCAAAEPAEDVREYQRHAGEGDTWLKNQ